MVAHIAAKTTKMILDLSIHEAANTASCGMFYQPRIPNELLKIKRKHK